MDIGNEETRVALIGIMLENTNNTEQMNELLHQYGKYIIGRMGLPYRERNLFIVSVVLDAPIEIISALSGKLGMIEGITTKVIYSKENK